MRGEAAQALEDVVVVLVVGAQLEAIALRDLQRHLEDVDRVQSEPLAEQRCANSNSSAVGLVVGAGPPVAVCSEDKVISPGASQRTGVAASQPEAQPLR